MPHSDRLSHSKWGGGGVMSDLLNAARSILEDRRTDAVRATETPSSLGPPQVVPRRDSVDLRLGPREHVVAGRAPLNHLNARPPPPYL